MKSFKVSAITGALLCLFSGTAMPIIGTANASVILQDGTFLQPIGTGLNLTPWSDWTNAGVTRIAAPDGITGNYASLAYGADLFQRFSGPTPGVYTLSFLAQNPTSHAAELVLDFQAPFGGGWHQGTQVLDLLPSSAFIRETFLVNLTNFAGTPSEFYFSNSYNYPDPSRGMQNSVNFPGTTLNVADISFTPGLVSFTSGSAVPEPGAFGLFGLGLLALGMCVTRFRHMNS